MLGFDRVQHRQQPRQITARDQRHRWQHRQLLEHAQMPGPRRHPKRRADQTVCRVSLIVREPDTARKEAKAALELTHAPPVVRNDPAEDWVLVEASRDRPDDSKKVGHGRLADVGTIRQRPNGQPRGVDGCVALHRNQSDRQR